MLNLRGSDKHGAGHWGASRGDRLHKAVDLAAPALSTSMAPVSGTVTKLGFVSAAKGKEHFRYVEVKDHYGNRHRCMYVAPTVNVGDKVEKDLTKIGVVQDLDKVYPGIINHVHYEIIDSGGRYRNPMPFLAA